jgi:hypothetical protein
MNCPDCGGVIVYDQRFCDDCGAQLDQGRETGDPAATTAAPVAAPPAPAATAPTVIAPAPAAVPGTKIPPAAIPATAIPATAVAAAAITARTLPGTPIVLADGERIWRQYQVSKLGTTKQGEGSLYVTDARVVYYARARGRGTQRPSALVQQTKIEHITGVQAYVSHRISLLLVGLTCLFGLIAIGSLAAKVFLSAIVFLILTAICVTVLVVEGSKRGSVGVTIYSRAEGPSPINFGRYGRRGFIGTFFSTLSRPFLTLFGVFTAFDVLVGFPGQDAEAVVAELGALILDLQTRGDLAAGHWAVDRGAVDHGAVDLAPAVARAR